MSISYHIKGDAGYFRAVRERYYQQRPFLLRLTSQFSIVGVCLVVPWIYAWASDAAWKDGASVGIPAGILVAFGFYYLTNVSILAKLQGGGKSTEGTVTLSEEGVTGRGQHGQSLQYWTYYPRAVRFSDGILLLRPGVVRWLPDSVIKEGTADDATTLVASNIGMRRLDR